LGRRSQLDVRFARKGNPVQAQLGVAVLGILICLDTSGCAHTRDLSSAPEYKPWIGKTVKLSGQKTYNIFAPRWQSPFIDSAASYSNYPILARFPEGYPVVIDAVKETKGTYYVVGPYTGVYLILSMELPGNKNKRIKVKSELNNVEPFRDRKGFKLDHWQVEDGPLKWNE
jgi:hypothetical protein